MELNSRGRNLLKEDPSVWSCLNCHDSNYFLIQPVLPMVKISIVEDPPLDPNCIGDSCDDIADAAEDDITPVVPLSIKIAPNVPSKDDLTPLIKDELRSLLLNSTSEPMVAVSGKKPPVAKTEVSNLPVFLFGLLLLCKLFDAIRRLFSGRRRRGWKMAKGHQTLKDDGGSHLKFFNVIGESRTSGNTGTNGVSHSGGYTQIIKRLKPLSFSVDEINQMDGQCVTVAPLMCNRRISITPEDDVSLEDVEYNTSLGSMLLDRRLELTSEADYLNQSSTCEDSELTRQLVESQQSSEAQMAVLKALIAERDLLLQSQDDMSLKHSEETKQAELRLQLLKDEFDSVRQASTAELLSLKDENSHLRAQIESLHQDVASVVELSNGQVVNNERLKEELASAMRALHTAETELTGIKGMLAERDKQLKELLNEKLVLENDKNVEIGSLLWEVEAHQKTINSLQTELKRTVNSALMKEANAEEVTRVNELRIENLRLDVLSRDSKIAGLLTMLDEMQSSDSSTSRSDLNSSLMEKLHGLQTEYDEFKSAAILEREMLVGRNAELEIQALVRVKEVEGLQVLVANRGETIQVLNAQLAAVKLDLIAARNECKTAEEEYSRNLEEIEEERNGAQAEVIRLDNEAAGRQEELEDLESELKQCREQVSQLEAELEEKLQDADEQRHLFDEVKASLCSKVTELESAVASHLDTIGQQTQTIKSLNFKIDDYIFEMQEQAVTLEELQKEFSVKSKELVESVTLNEQLRQQSIRDSEIGSAQQALLTDQVKQAQSLLDEAHVEKESLLDRLKQSETNLSASAWSLEKAHFDHESTLALLDQQKLKTQQLEAENENVRGEYFQVSTRLGECSKELAGLRMLHADANSKLQASQESSDSLVEEMTVNHKRFSERLDEIMRELDSVSVEKTVLEQKLSELISLNEELQNSVSESEAANETLTSQLHEKTQALEEWKQRVHSLKITLSGTQSELQSQNEQLLQQIETHEQVLSGTELELTNVRAELDRRKAEYDLCSEKVQELTNAVAELTSVNREQKEDLMECEESISALHSRVIELTARVDDLTDESTQQKSMIGRLNLEVEQLSAQLALKEAVANDLRDELAEKSDEYSKSLEERTAENTMLEEAVKLLTSQLSTASSVANDLRDELAQKTEEYSKSLEERTAENTMLEEAVKLLTSQLSTANSELTLSQDASFSLSLQVQSLTSQLATAQNAVEDQQTINDALQYQIKSLDRRIIVSLEEELERAEQMLQVQSSELNGKQASADSAEKQLMALGSRKDELDAEFWRKLESVSLLEKDVDVLENAAESIDDEEGETEVSLGFINEIRNKQEALRRAKAEAQQLKILVEDVRVQIASKQSLVLNLKEAVEICQHSIESLTAAKIELRNQIHLRDQTLKDIQKDIKVLQSELIAKDLALNEALAETSTLQQTVDALNESIHEKSFSLLESERTVKELQQINADLSAEVAFKTNDLNLSNDQIEELQHQLEDLSMELANKSYDCDRSLEEIKEFSHFKNEIAVEMSGIHRQMTSMSQTVDEMSEQLIEKDKSILECGVIIADLQAAKAQLNSELLAATEAAAVEMQQFKELSMAELSRNYSAVSTSEENLVALQLRNSELVTALNEKVQTVRHLQATVVELLEAKTNLSSQLETQATEVAEAKVVVSQLQQLLKVEINSLSEVQLELSSSQLKVEVLEKTNLSLTDELSLVRQTVLDYEVTIAELRGLRDTLSADLKDALVQLRSSEQTVLELTGKCKSLEQSEQELANLRRMCDELQSIAKSSVNQEELYAAVRAKDDLASQLSAVLNDLEVSREFVAQLQRESLEADEKRHTAEGLLSNIQIRLKQEEDDHRNLKNMWNEVKSELYRLTANARDNNSELPTSGTDLMEGLPSELGKLLVEAMKGAKQFVTLSVSHEKVVEDLQTRTQDNQKLLEQLKATSDEIEKLKAELVTTMSMHQSEVLDLKAVSQQLTATLSLKSLQLDQAWQQCESLQSQIEELEEELGEVSFNLNQSELLNGEVVQSREELLEELQQRCEEVDNLTLTLHETRIALDESTVALNERKIALDLAKELVDFKTTELTKVSTELEVTKIQLAAAKDQLDHLLQLSQDRNSSVSSDVAAKQAVIASLQENNLQLTEKLTVASKAVVDLKETQQRLEVTQNVLTVLRANQQKHDIRVQEITAQLTETEHNLSVVVQERDELSLELNNRSVEYSQVEESLTDLQQEKDSLSQQFVDLSAALAQAEQTIAELNQSTALLKGELKYKSKEIEVLTKREAELETSNDRLFSELTDQNQKLSLALQEVALTKESHKAALMEKSDIQQSVELLNSTVERLTSELSSCSSQLSSVEDAKAKLLQFNTSLIEKLKASKQNVEALQSQNAELRVTGAHLKEELEKITAQLHQRANAVQPQESEELQSVRAARDILQSDLDEALHRLSELTEVLSGVAGLETDLSLKSLEITQLQSELRELRSVNQELTEQMTNNSMSIQFVEQNGEELKHFRRVESEDAAASLNISTDEIDAFNDSINTVRSELQLKLSALGSPGGRISGDASPHSNAEVSPKTLTEDAEKKTQLIFSLTNTINDLTKELNDAHKDLSILQKEANADLSEVEGERDALLLENAALQEAIAKYVTDLQLKQDECVALQDEAAQLFALKQNLQQKIKDLEARLGDQQNDSEWNLRSEQYELQLTELRATVGHQQRELKETEESLFQAIGDLEKALAASSALQQCHTEEIAKKDREHELKIAELEKDLLEMTEAFNDKEEQLNGFIASNEELQQRVISKSQSLFNTDLRIADLEEQHLLALREVTSRLHSKEEELKHSTERVSALEKSVAHLQRKIDSLVADRKTAQQQLETVSREGAEMKTSFVQLQSHIGELNQQIVELSQCSAGQASLIDELQLSVSYQKNELSLLNDEKEQLLKYCDELSISKSHDLTTALNRIAELEHSLTLVDQEESQLRLEEQRLQEEARSRAEEQAMLEAQELERQLQEQALQETLLLHRERRILNKEIQSGLDISAMNESILSHNDDSRSGASGGLTALRMTLEDINHQLDARAHSIAEATQTVADLENSLSLSRVELHNHLMEQVENISILQQERQQLEAQLSAVASPGKPGSSSSGHNDSINLTSHSHEEGEDRPLDVNGSLFSMVDHSMNDSSLDLTSGSPDSKSKRKRSGSGANVSFALLNRSIAEIDEKIEENSELIQQQNNTVLAIESQLQAARESLMQYRSDYKGLMTELRLVKEALDDRVASQQTKLDSTLSPVRKNGNSSLPRSFLNKVADLPASSISISGVSGVTYSLEAHKVNNEIISLQAELTLSRRQLERENEELSEVVKHFHQERLQLKETIAAFNTAGEDSRGQGVELESILGKVNGYKLQLESKSKEIEQTTAVVQELESKLSAKRILLSKLAPGNTTNVGPAAGDSPSNTTISTLHSHDTLLSGSNLPSTNTMSRLLQGGGGSAAAGHVASGILSKYTASSLNQEFDPEGEGGVDDNAATSAADLSGVMSDLRVKYQSKSDQVTRASAHISELENALRENQQNLRAEIRQMKELLTMLNLEKMHLQQQSPATGDSVIQMRMKDREIRTANDKLQTLEKSLEHADSILHMHLEQQELVTASLSQERRELEVQLSRGKEPSKSPKKTQSRIPRLGGK